MKQVVFLVLLFISGVLSAQEYVYVNTDNLILRDRPEQMYNVFAILHAACKLKIEPYDDDYEKDKAVHAKFLRVSLTYVDSYQIHCFITGWVVKKYVVPALKKITVRGADTTRMLNITEMQRIPYMGDDAHNPNPYNATAYSAPKYKGGEPQAKDAGWNKKCYHSGPRGGCYYYGGRGQKIYVDKRYCK